jgi:hypothetical protein
MLRLVCLACFNSFLVSETYQNQSLKKSGKLKVGVVYPFLMKLISVFAYPGFGTDFLYKMRNFSSFCNDFLLLIQRQPSYAVRVS